MGKAEGGCDGLDEWARLASRRLAEMGHGLVGRAKVSRSGSNEQILQVLWIGDETNSF